VNPSMGARTRLPVSYGPATRHYTPSASWVNLVLWILTDKHGVRLKLGRVVTIRTVSDRDVAPEPPMDGFMGVSW
jgi:hypothetical protein